jgi:hypothetical protein
LLREIQLNTSEWMEIIGILSKLLLFSSMQNVNEGRHWLDTGEFLTSFAFAYDWLYDAWNSSQRNAIMWTMISLGLRKAIDAYAEDAWFLSVNGNWNC